MALQIIIPIIGIVIVAGVIYFLLREREDGSGEEQAQTSQPESTTPVGGGAEGTSPAGGESEHEEGSSHEGVERQW